MYSPFPCCPLNCKCSWKKTQKEKKHFVEYKPGTFQSWIWHFSPLSHSPHKIGFPITRVSPHPYTCLSHFLKKKKFWSPTSSPQTHLNSIQMGLITCLSTKINLATTVETVLFLTTWKMFIKCTLMQIWKLSYMFVFIWKQYPENFAFLILGTLELFAREVCKFLK